MDKLVIYKQY